MSDVSSYVNTGDWTTDCLSNLKSLQIQIDSIGKSIVIDDNGKLKWTEDYEALKNFVKKALKLDGKWSSRGPLKLSSLQNQLLLDIIQTLPLSY